MSKVQRIRRELVAGAAGQGAAPEIEQFSTSYIVVE